MTNFLFPSLSCSRFFSSSSSSSFFTTTSTVILLLSISFSLFCLNTIIILSLPNNSNIERETIPIDGGAFGPESLTFDANGEGPYTGVSDGRILKWLQFERRWSDFAAVNASPSREGCGGPSPCEHVKMEHICGRPLGLSFNKRTGDLYIADAYMGLLVVGLKGGWASPILLKAQNTSQALKFTNGIDIDQKSGLVYFTISSTQYQRRNYVSLIVSRDTSGSLMRYDPISQNISILIKDLAFPNGVLLSKDTNSILIAESTNCRILRYWLETEKAGTIELFAELPGFPDNIKRNDRGEIWVGLHARKTKWLNWILSKPWVGEMLANLPFDITKGYSYLGRWKGVGLALKLNENGKIVKVLEDSSGNGWKYISEVVEKDGILWIASIKMPFVGILPI
ncbi:protein STRICTOSIDINE SYNTHASE-LIKE 10-like [Impatiens glandulifera]|uniref:protein STRICTOSIDINE SYNTHASE-LIKE 10-like n=1 Tax=Impatiens glandulifera TaxID=253017 RepID=UPI001FB190C3|nr:protein STRICTOSIDINE SYNTHASE-LIKE 10-like [Impatiens glandulifera]